MNMIVRRAGNENALVPFYRPWDLLADVDTLARDMWDAWQPFGLDHSLIPHTDMYEEKGKLVMKTELPGIDIDHKGGKKGRGKGRRYQSYSRNALWPILPVSDTPLPGERR